MKRTFFRLGFLVALLAAAACSKRATGSENGECYANGTCNDGLTCLSNTCVSASGDAGPLSDSAVPTDADMASGSGDAAVVDAATVVDDAGLVCPSASIFHPGTETRTVGTSVPFTGRGRDPACAAITGTNLVWTDSLEGQIGTGEMFNHTFTMVGTHTVTLVAKDSAQTTYSAMVTFLIM